MISIIVTTNKDYGEGNPNSSVGIFVIHVKSGTVRSIPDYVI